MSVKKENSGETREERNDTGGDVTGKRNRERNAKKNMYPWADILTPPNEISSKFDDKGIRNFMLHRGVRLESQYRSRKAWFIRWSWCDRSKYHLLFAISAVIWTQICLSLLTLTTCADQYHFN